MINDKNLSYPGWKAIYPVDSAIQPLNNRGLFFTVYVKC